jgi:hypothetical protein
LYRFLETWPPIYRGQERPGRDRLRLSQVQNHAYSRLYLGIILGRAGLGRAERKPDSIFCCLGLAQPDYRVAFSCPGLARRAKNSSGHRAGPSVNSCFSRPKPGLVLLSGQKILPRSSPIACFGLTGWAIFGLGRAGSSGQAAHAQIYSRYTPCLTALYL